MYLEQAMLSTLRNAKEEEEEQQPFNCFYGAVIRLTEEK